MKVYTGSAWVAAYVSGTGFVDLASAQTITGVKTFDNGLATDTISEETSAAGVTVDGVLLKDSQVSTDQINEKTSATGVTIDGVLLKDSGVVTGAGTVSAPVYSTTGDLNTGIFFPAADTIAFAEGGAEAMRITSNGEVLIGGTVELAQTSGYLALQRTDAAGGLDFFRNDTSISSTNILGQIRFFGNDSTSNTPSQFAYIRATASGTHGAGDNPTDLVFATTPDNSSSVTEQARITEAGNLQFNSGYGSVATAYGCRAWVNFDGTGTPAIREDGNVSSITDNGTGDYTVNFTTAMPDENYAAVATAQRNNNGGTSVVGLYGGTSLVQTASTVRVQNLNFTPVLEDPRAFCVAIFR